MKSILETSRSLVALTEEIDAKSTKEQKTKKVNKKAVAKILRLLAAILTAVADKLDDCED